MDRRNQVNRTAILTSKDATWTLQSFLKLLHMTIGAHCYRQKEKTRMRRTTTIIAGRRQTHWHPYVTHLLASSFAYIGCGRFLE